jgi:hypothetical protein
MTPKVSEGRGNEKLNLRKEKQVQRTEEKQRKYKIKSERDRS